MEEFPPDTTERWLKDSTTSPSQLQEITLEQDNYSIRSPGGPMRGRSVKEIEEQLSTLKKENFHLKLRIYFLEERMGPNFQLDKENVIKNNIELNVEVETLKKEVESKTELLEQALKALELQDEEYKKIKIEKDEQNARLEEEMKDLKALVTANTETELSTNCLSVADNNAQILKELEDKVEYLEKELNEEKSNTSAIQTMMSEKDQKIKNLTDELKIVHNKNVEIQEQYRILECRYREMSFENQQAMKKLKEKSRIIEDIMEQNNEMRKKYHGFKNEAEKEAKRAEKLEQNTLELETKLQQALHELRKSQDLVVAQKCITPNENSTDADYFLAKKSTSPNRVQKKDTITLPKNNVSSPSITPTTPTTTSIVSPPSSPKSIKLLDNLNELTPDIVLQIKDEFRIYQKENIKLKADQVKACKIIKTMIDKTKQKEELNALKNENSELLKKFENQKREMEELQRKCRDLERELEGVVTKPRKSDMNLTEANPQPDEIMDVVELKQYRLLVDQLEEKNQLLAATLKEKSNQMDHLQEQQNNLQKALNAKEKQIIDLQFELLSQENSEKPTSFFEKIIEEKDVDIAKLNNELIKKNSDLQGIVNNELWQKNREIEKLQKLHTTNIDNSGEIIKLRNELTIKDSQLKTIKSKINELGIDLEDAKISDNLQEELQKSEKLRNEANKMCAILSGRLEELAIFLDSLLKQKSVLGLLGTQENKKLRQIVEYSLDLTRSFSLSLTLNPDESLAQLSNLSAILNNPDPNVSYKSHLYNDNEEIIETLRLQIVNLKHELKLRDVELSKLHGVCSDNDSGDFKKTASRSTVNTTTTTLKYQSDHSESEAWSEPDRNVSRERIGLVLDKKTEKSSESEEDLLANRGGVKKSPSENRAAVLELHRQVCELDIKLNETEQKLSESEKIRNFIIAQLEEERGKNEKLKENLENIDLKLKQTERQFEDAENRVQQSERKINEYEQIVEELNEFKRNLEDCMAVKDKEVLNRINQIQIEKEDALKLVQRAQYETERARHDKKQAEEMIINLKEEIEEIRLRSEEIALRKIKEVEDRSQTEIVTLKKSLTDLHNEYTNNYVKKCELENTFSEVEILKKTLKAAELREKDLKEKLHDYQEKYKSARNDLDNATLQFSEAVLEKTKITNDKANLEKELSTYSLKEAEMRKQLNEIQQEVNEDKDNYQRHVQNLQTQKSKLEVRISELESSNAELHNKLIKLQAKYGEQQLFSTSLPGYLLQIPFKRQTSENSGYTSEEQQAEEARSRFLPYNRLVGDFERNESNSSPDLGIESDHGRFSSLETQLNLPRPFLQSLELTESMNNLLDGENNSTVQHNACANDVCIQKLQGLIYENADLKKKLLRTRRALEETGNQLALANQRKKEVEKNISKQILKTSLVLRKAKANLDSGSETDITKK